MCGQQPRKPAVAVGNGVNGEKIEDQGADQHQGMRGLLPPGDSVPGKQLR